MTTTEQQSFNAMRNALATFIEYNDNGGPLSFDVDAMWANARAALAGAEAGQDEVDTLRQQLVEAQAENEAVRKANLDCVDHFNQMRDSLSEAHALIEASRQQSPFTYYVPATDKIRPFRSDGDLPLYVAPVVAPDVQHANLLEVMKDIVQLWDHRCYEHGDGMPSRLHIRAKAAIAAMGGAND